MRAPLQITATVALAVFGVALLAPAAIADPGNDTALPPVALSVTSPHTGAFIDTNTVEIQGTKTAGSSIHLPGLNGCTIPADVEETWRCSIRNLPNGPGLAIAPVQTLDGVNTTLDPAIRIDVLGPPTMDGGATVLTTGVISGTAYPGATVILGIGATESICPVPARGDGYWSCTLNVDSNSYPVQVWQTIATIGSPPNNLSRPTSVRMVTVDRDPPAQPVVSTPRNGQRVLTQPTTFAGSGETGGRVDAYVDRTIVCSATVVEGRWSCQAGDIPNGRHSVQAIITDAAGNYGTPSAPIWVDFGPEGAVAPPPPPTSEDPATPPSPSPTETSPPLLPPDWPPKWPLPDSAAPSLQEALTNWGTPTGYGRHLPSPAMTATNGNWLLGLALAVGFLLLLALPLRLLLGTMRGRVRFRRIQLTGRNRGLPTNTRPISTLPTHSRPTALVDEAPSTVNPWLAALVPLAAATALVLFAGGFGGEVRYLRLAFSVGLGLGILNLVGVAIAGKLAAAGQRISGRLKVLPTLLVGTAIAAVVSRVAGIEPPFLIGVFVAVVLAKELPARSKAVVGLIELVTITLLAVGAWLLQQAIGPVDGFWASIPSETLTTIAVAGFSSVIVLLLPIGALPGRAILEWSATAWVVSTLLLVTVAAAVLLGETIRLAPIAVALGCAAGFAAIAVASWAWARYVEPSPLEPSPLEPQHQDAA